jgi:hypothetical protein
MAVDGSPEMRRSALALLVIAAGVLAGAAAPPPGPQIRTEDVTRFYRVYDAANGAPSAAALQRDYLDAGTPGVREFIPQRIISAERLADKIAASREIYDKARSCEKMLPGVKVRLRAAFAKLARIYPQASFPPVTILVGRNNSGGTTGPSGVLIGLEVACRADWLDGDLESRFVHLISHEYGHVEQHPDAGGEDQTPGDVLRQSLDEGGAEMVGELISGQVSNAQLKTWTKGHELEIETAFVKDKHSKDLSHWLYNGVGTPEKPGDLGYWVGYRITKSYYLHAHDKRQAIYDIFHITDPDAFLARSGWTPGMRLPG